MASIAFSPPQNGTHDTNTIRLQTIRRWCGSAFENDDVRIIFIRPGFIENPYITRATLCTAMEHNFKNLIKNGLSVTRRTFPGEEMKSRV